MAEMKTTVNSWLFSRNERPFEGRALADYKKYPDDQVKKAKIRKEIEQKRFDRELENELKEVWD